MKKKRRDGREQETGTGKGVLTEENVDRSREKKREKKEREGEEREEGARGETGRQGQERSTQGNVDRVWGREQ